MIELRPMFSGGRLVGDERRIRGTLLHPYGSMCSRMRKRGRNRHAGDDEKSQ